MNMNIVLFDGVCNLCNKTVLFLIKQDKNNHLHFAAMQTIAGESIIKKHAVKTNFRSVVFIKDELVFYKSDAVIEIVKQLSGWPRIAMIGLIFPRFLRNWIYDLVANNRYKFFGKQASCSMPSKANKHKFIS